MFCFQNIVDSTSPSNVAFCKPNVKICNRRSEPLIENLASFIFSSINDLKENKEETPEPPEPVVIPDGFQGLVIGRGGETLKKISSQTGAYLFRERRNVYMNGPLEARQKAKLQIKYMVVRGYVCKHCRTIFHFTF